MSEPMVEAPAAETGPESAIEATPEPAVEVTEPIAETVADQEQEATPAPVAEAVAERRPAATFEPDPDANLGSAIEALLLVANEPISDEVLAHIIGRPRPEVSEAVRKLAQEYTEADRGFELREAAGGWRLYTRQAYAPYVERFITDGQQARLTQAALETLAVVAYRQPVSRSKVSGIRGVNCDGVMRTLAARGLVIECGTEPTTGAYLYQTTGLFLEKLGISSVEELPPIAPLLPDMDTLDDVVERA
jgi:segregation and condensation protein B